MNILSMNNSFTYRPAVSHVTSLTRALRFFLSLLFPLSFFCLVLLFGCEKSDAPKPVEKAPEQVVLAATSRNEAVDLVWEAPDDGGSPLTGYNVYVDGQLTDDSPLAGTTTEYTVTGLTNGQEYAFQVAAVNEKGEGELSEEITVTPRSAEAPGKPFFLNPASLDRAVKLSWIKPSDNGFSITGYNLYVDGVAQAISPPETNLPRVEYTVTELTNGQAYTFRVAAVNEKGEGELSEEITVIPRSPQAPQQPVISSAAPLDGVVKLIWNEPEDNDFPITGYNLYVDGKLTDDSPLAATPTEYTVTGLINGQEYAFRVAAVNENGEGEPSQEAVATPMASSTTSSPVVRDFKDVVQKGQIPSDKSSYSSRGQELLSLYRDGAAVAVRYVSAGGRGSKDGLSEENAAAQLKTVLDGIDDASSDRVYVVFVEAGTYDAGEQMAMKSHVAIVAEAGVALSGGGAHRVFNNVGIDQTALLFGATITKGMEDTERGGGMANDASSPTLYEVVFTDNLSTSNFGIGGGMSNVNNSSPTLYDVTFTNNRADGSVGLGGGMYNDQSSPKLYNVTFANNSALGSGGGMFNRESSSKLYNVTFANNSAGGGGGMINIASSPVLANVAFANNSAGIGGGMYNVASSPILANVTFSNNSSSRGGGGMFVEGSGNALVLNTVFWENSAPTGSQIGIFNENSDTNRLTLYNSLIAGGVGVVDDDDTPLKSGEATKTIKNGGIGSTDASADIIVVFENILSDDPDLGSLADNGGSVQTLALSAGSPAKDKGVYVRKSGDDYYLGETSDSWRKLTYNSVSQTWDVTADQRPPVDATDLVATDARGYRRTDLPDLGAYEIGGEAP